MTILGWWRRRAERRALRKAWDDWFAEAMKPPWLDHAWWTSEDDPYDRIAR